MEGGVEPRVCEGSAGVKEEDEKLSDTENTDGGGKQQKHNEQTCRM